VSGDPEHDRRSEGTGPEPGWVRDGAPQVVVVGAASRDVARDDPRGWRLGGGVSYASLSLSRLGLRTAALIGVDADAATADELDAIRAAGVAVHLVPLAAGPVFENVETPEGRVQRCVAASDPIDPQRMPPGWDASGAWLFAPVADEVPDSWASVPDAAAYVALGWQGLLRELRPGTVVSHRTPARSALLSRADLVGVGRDDLAPSTSIDDLAALLRPGARLLLTHGPAGGLAVEIGADGRPLGRRAWPAIPAAGAIDPTGAGDVFLAGVLAARAEPRLVGGRIGGGWDLRLGAAMASLTCDATGLDGVPDRAAVRRRLMAPQAS
jgi:sugar/nucleoside kinase (ribokinase family)